LDGDRLGGDVAVDADPVARLIAEQDRDRVQPDLLHRLAEALLESRPELVLEGVLERLRTESARNRQPDSALLGGQAPQEFGIKIHPQAGAGPVLAQRIAMAEVMVEAPIRHRREQRRVARRIEHLVHVDMIEGLVPKFAPLDGIDELGLDRRRSRREVPLRNAIHQAALLSSRRLQISTSASVSASIISALCVGPGVKRRRSLPRGTVGKLIGWT